MPAEYIRVTPDGPEDQMTDEQAAIHVARDFGGAPGQVHSLAIETEYDKKDAMNALDPELTGRRWDAFAEAWTVDFDKLNYVVETLTDRGHTVTVDISVAQTFEDTDRVFLPDSR